MKKAVIDGREVFVCKECGEELLFNATYDAYYCAKCDEWAEPQCGDDCCDYCRNRPERPSLCK